LVFETVQTSLASNSKSSCLSLSNAGVTGVHYHTWLISVLIFSFSFSGTGGWTQSLTLGRQVLSHLSHPPTTNPFSFLIYFWNRVSHFFVQVGLNHDTLIYTSHVAGITGAH
jgi:hypothetical protein